MNIINRRFKISIVVGLIIISALFYFFISYQIAKQRAVDYLQIVTINNEESFQRVKKEIYDISPKEVQESLFADNKLEIGTVPVITYDVNKAVGKIIGFNHYLFTINWTSNGYLTINTALDIKNGRVINTYRVD